MARGSDSFGYDQANRLVSAAVDGVSSSYVYDGDGTRASNVVGVVTRSYVSDIKRVLPVVLDDGTRKYIWGPGLLYAVVNSEGLTPPTTPVSAPGWNDRLGVGAPGHSASGPCVKE